MDKARPFLNGGRILVVKLSSLGDIFHALPAVHALRHGGARQVDWVTQPEYAALVRCFPDVDRVITFPRRHFFRSFRSFCRALRVTDYDAVLDLQGLFKSALTARLARAPRRIGPSFYREGVRGCYTEVAGPRNKDRHAVEEIMDVVTHIGSAPADPVFECSFPPMPVTGSSPRVAYLPCSRWETKNWPPAHFATVINAVHAACGGQAFLLGSGSDQTVLDFIQEHVRAPLHNLAGRTDLVQLGRWLQAMDLLVTVDSGPMHMAAALGIPVVALFGATDPLRTGPYGSGHVVLQHGKLDCQPCRSRRCLRPTRDIACLRDLEPDRVTATVIAKLKP